MSCPSGATVARGRSYNTTVAYAPEDLSTAMSARPQQTECTYITVNYTMLGDYSSSGNPDFFLSIPSSLTSLDPAWSTCTPALYGAWDPPTTLRPATALTDPAEKITPSSPASPAGRSTSAYAPATKTTAAASPKNVKPSAASVPSPSQPSKLPKTDVTELTDPPIAQNSHRTAASGGLSSNIHTMPSGKDKKPDPSDPLDITSSMTSAEDGDPNPSGPSIVSSTLRSPLISKESDVQAPSRGAEIGAMTYTTDSVADIHGQNPSIGSSAIIMSGSIYDLPPPSAPTPTLPLINGKPIARVPNGGLVFASATVAPGSQTTIFSHTISVGLSEAVIDGSKYVFPAHTAEKAKLSPLTLVNGIVTSLDGDPYELKIGDVSISINEPEITIPGAIVSLAPPELYISPSVLPSTVATNSSSAGLGDLGISAFQSGQSSAGRGSNNSNPVVFTGGTLRSPNAHSIGGLALITAIVAMVDLAL